MMKTLRKLLCLLLVSIMLLPSAIPIANAAGDNEIVNLYDVAQAERGRAPEDANSDTLDEGNGYYTSRLIEVNEGDTVTVGPILQTNEWFIRAYDEDGDSVATVTHWECTWNEEIRNNAWIFTYTVPKDVDFIRVTTSYTFYDCTIITKNRVFTKDEYFAEMDREGVNVDFLCPADAEGELVNLFPAPTDDILRGAVKDGVFVESISWRSRIYEVGAGKDLQVGDVIYFAATRTDQRQIISYIREDETTENVLTDALFLYEDLKREYGIYVYRVSPGTKKVAVNFGTGVYDDGITLVTKNQAFSGDRYREMFGIDLDEDILDEESPLYGLKGLFIGDSISYGGHDHISYTDHSTLKELRVGWAGGIAAHTGLISTNASVPSARISYRASLANGDGHWIYNQMVPYFGEKFDIVVMHGGVNDCPLDRHVIGKTLPLTATEEELWDALQSTEYDPDGTKTSFLAGLQWTFYNARKNFPDAELFFIANYPTPAQANRSPLGEFMAAAKPVCEMYDVYYIDLYNNQELVEKLAPDTMKNLDDTLHPNSLGYDILEPYIKEPIEAVMCPKTDSHVFSVEGKDETHRYNACRYCGTIDEGSRVELSGDNGDGDAGSDSGGDGDVGTGSGGGGDAASGCGSVVSGTAALVTLALILPAAIAVKKKDEE